MNLWIILAMFFSIVMTDKDLYIFTQDESALSKCIEDYLQNSKDPYYREVGIAKVIADRVAGRFYGKAKSRRLFLNAINQLYYEIQKRKWFIFRNNQVHKPLHSAIKTALIFCADIVQSDLDVQPVPNFTGEPREIGAVLDYILVDWPKTLHEMIGSRKGRAVLRRYAEEARIRLSVALNSVGDHGCFRHLIRLYWMHRAQYYFDGHNRAFPYLHYSYTLSDPYPHTYTNLAVLISRNSSNLLYRNPPVLQEDFDRIMQIHVPDCPGYGEYDVFSVYERIGTMTNSQYYIETHIDQFYRILFFFIEMQIHGISTDEQDIYNGPLPYDVIPVRLLIMLHHDLIYRDYLLSLRRLLKKTITKNSQFQIDIRQSLSSARVREEDLIFLLSIWIQNNFYSSTNTSSITESSFISSTTPKNKQPKRKGSILMNDRGKHFCKQSGTTFSEEKQQHYQDNNRYYGYNTYTDDLINEMNSATEELLSTIKIEASSSISFVKI